MALVLVVLAEYATYFFLHDTQTAAVLFDRSLSLLKTEAGHLEFVVLRRSTTDSLTMAQRRTIGQRAGAAGLDFYDAELQVPSRLWNFTVDAGRVPKFEGYRNGGIVRWQIEPVMPLVLRARYSVFVSREVSASRDGVFVWVLGSWVRVREQDAAEADSPQA